MMYPVVEAKDVTVNYIASALRNAYVQVVDIDPDNNEICVLIDELHFLIRVFCDENSIIIFARRHCVIRKDYYKDVCYFLNENINSIGNMKFIVTLGECENLPKEQSKLYFVISRCVRFNYGLNIAQLIDDLRFLNKEYQGSVRRFVDYLDKEEIICWGS